MLRRAVHSLRGASSFINARPVSFVQRSPLRSFTSSKHMTQAQMEEEDRKQKEHDQKIMDGYRNSNFMVAGTLVVFALGVYKYSIWAVEDGKDTFSPEEMREIEAEIDAELAQQKELAATMDDQSKSNKQ